VHVANAILEAKGAEARLSFGQPGFSLRNQALIYDYIVETEILLR